MGPESLDYLDRMQKAASRMQMLINDLLTFSRVTTKAHPFTPVNLAEMASDVVKDLEGRIELVKGRVELGTLPVIDAEPLQMRQLLQNLIGNALKFRRPEERPVVKVEAEIIPDLATPEKNLCRLTVSDNCIGFDEKYLDRIFNVFQRLHTRNEYEGTGMGWPSFGRSHCITAAISPRKANRARLDFYLDDTCGLSQKSKRRKQGNHHKKENQP